jgi:DNA-binding beta-propeller fold protein YncE
MRAGKIIARAIAAVIAVAVVVAAVLIRAPSFRRATAPPPHASFVRVLGDSGPGKLAHPIGVAASHAGEIFVSSSDDHRIVVFHPDGGFARAFGREGNGPGELERPMHISIGPDGLLYVAEYLNDRISVFNLDGTFVRHLTAQGLDAPGGVAVDKSGVVYVANFYGHDVLVLSTDGKLAHWGRAGRVWYGELHYPTDVAVAPDDSLWVADAYNNRLQRLVDGRSTNIVGWDLGLRTFGFRVATGLGVDALGRIYGADFGHGKVRVFDARGTPLESFGRAGNGPGEFDRPEGVAVQGTHLYVTDFGNNRLQEWRLEERR